MRELGRKLVAALDDFMRPPIPAWLTTWYWLDRWDNWRQRRRGEEFEEWRVTGVCGNGWPDYDFTWSPDRNPHLGDPETAARAFVAQLANHTPKWEDGPHLSMRRIKRSQWREP